MNTHVHADHVTGSGMLKQVFPSCKSILSASSGGKADLYVNHGDKVEFGNCNLEVRSTPGHTDGKRFHKVSLVENLFVNAVLFCMYMS